MERSDFIELMQPNKEVCEVIQYLHERCLASVTAYRQKISERIQVTPMIRKVLLEIQKQVYTKIIEIEDSKKVTEPASA